MKLLIYIFLVLLITSCNNLNPFLEKDLLERPKSVRCADCHQKIYQQWKKSRHYHSWISEKFKTGTQNYSKVKCLSCHAPYEIKIGEKPELRNSYREDGINCASCHFKDKTKSMHGPYTVFSPPHPSTQDIEYTKSKICSGCHQKTFKEWKKTGSNKTCQSCHMPAKKDKIIQKFPFDLFHSKKELHNHSFLTLKAKKQDFDIKLLRTDGQTVSFAIINKTIPHNLPTADQGNPKFYITVEFYLDNKFVYKDYLMLQPKEDEAFLYKQQRFLEFTSFDKYNIILVYIERKLSWQKKKELILKKKWKL